MSGQRPQRDELARLFPGDGEMAAPMRALDWAATPLGPPESWPQSLRSAIVSLLVSKAQIIFVWGDDLITLYNDAYQATGAIVRPAASVREAWSAFAERTPDVVVSDISMPDEDGYALLRRMKAGGANGSVPAIALTGFSASEDKTRVLSAGFVAHVPKPIEPDVLVEVLSRVVTRHRAGGKRLH